jgi:uncharacterized protein YecE (DUF72 family)
LKAQPGSANYKASVRIGCAGWALRPQYAEHFPATGSHLERYAATFNAVEINSAFYRPHRRSTYERWAASVPDDFRFSVKLPREITHVRRLTEAADVLHRFIDETSGLGVKLGPILVQLPPKFEFDAARASDFLSFFRSRFGGDIVWEPRHATWFSGEVETLFGQHRISRVAADPANIPGAGDPAGSPAITYYRLHGSPRIYYSKYTSEFLAGIASRIGGAVKAGSEAWCIFDNTALGAATEDALALKSLLQSTAERR